MKIRSLMVLPLAATMMIIITPPPPKRYRRINSNIMHSAEINHCINCTIQLLVLNWKIIRN